MRAPELSNCSVTVFVSFATTIVATRIPRTETEWRALPGIGPYTAAAVSAFAQHARTIPIDTNVRRVVGRAWFGKPFADQKDDERVRGRLAKDSARIRRHWDVPQALMDLGATICTMRNPRCAHCPLRSTCPVADRFMSDHPPTKRPSAHHERKRDGKTFPDRIYRGRILAYIRTRGPTRCSDIGAQVDPEFNPSADADWIRAMIARLAKDGLLIYERGDIVSLPHS